MTPTPDEHIVHSTGAGPGWGNRDAGPEHPQRSRHAPSPPLDRSPPMDYSAESDLDEWEGRERRSERRRRHRQRSRTPEDESVVERRILRPGDEVTLIERHRGRPSEDYDWYDEEGMRVRVREI
jgi:hypothetical protein